MKRIKSLAVIIFTLAVSASTLHCATPSVRKQKTDVENAELTGKVKTVRETYGDETFVVTGYDEHGYQIEYNAYYADEGYEDKISYKNKYDENGNRIEQNIYNSGGSFTHQVAYKYDKHGNNTEAITLDTKGYLIGKRVFVFDGKGNVIDRCSYGTSTDIPPFEKFSYTYDSKGNLIEGNGYSSSGRVTTNFTCKYNDRNNCIEQHTYYTSTNANGTGQTS